MNTSTSDSAGRLGSFNNQALAAGHEFDARDFTTEDSILGLTREAGYRVDNARTPDVWMAWGESVPSFGVSRRR